MSTSRNPQDPPALALQTRLIHAARPRPGVEGSVVLPIFQSSTYVYGGEDGYLAVPYHRLNNSPNVRVLSARLASICEAEAAMVASSGMAAVHTTLLTLLKTGDHVLAQRGLYGGTHALLHHELANLGITVTLVDATAPATWPAALQPATKLFLVEAITNPCLEVGELAAVADFCRAHGLTSILDNTFATPINFRPIPQLGFDVELHSATKYLGGHSDLTAGVVLGSRDFIGRYLATAGHLGTCLGPQDCFLLERSLKTLALRVSAHNHTALTLATALERHPAVASVLYPGLPGSPDHARASRWFSGFGGVLSFTLAADRDPEAFLAALDVVVHAVSLGGAETLATRPAVTSHAALDAATRASMGITDGLIRLAVGLEAPADLLADLDQAFDRARR
jgi:cystathionine beta-lyase/cystathionine gamma-synthase